MFQIQDYQRVPDSDRYRFYVETSDPSLFDLLNIIKNTAEFLGILTYRIACARRVSESDENKEKIEKENREFRSRMLDIYESVSGSQKEKWHVVLAEVKASGKNWMNQDDVIILLKIARSERKESIKSGLEQEHRKSA